MNKTLACGHNSGQKRTPARKLVLNRSIKRDVIFDAMLIVCFRGVGGSWIPGSKHLAKCKGSSQNVLSLQDWTIKDGTYTSCATNNVP